jgi:hypothetical protein
MPVFYGLLTMFGVIGGGIVAYVRWFRPIKPAISLERLKSISTAVSFGRLPGAIRPSVSLEHLTPVPITLAPAIPVGPFKPIPIPKRPVPFKPIKIKSVALTPVEILERLKQASVPLKPRILTGEPRRPRALLEELKLAAKPSGPAISLGRLAIVAKPTAPEAPPRRPKRAPKPSGLGAARKHLRRKPVAKVEPYREKQMEGTPEVLKRLKKVASGRTGKGKRKKL